MDVGTQQGQQQQQQQRRGVGATTSTFTPTPKRNAGGAAAALRTEAEHQTRPQEGAHTSLGGVGQTAGLAAAGPSGPDAYARQQPAAERKHSERNQTQGGSQGCLGDGVQEEFGHGEQEVELEVEQEFAHAVQAVEREVVLGYVLVSLSQPMALLPPPFPR